MNSSINAINDALIKRDLKPQVLNLADAKTLLVLKYGGALRAINGTAPDLTLGTARAIAKDKRAASYVASQLDLPLPASEQYESPTQAVQFMKQWGRIVVKPVDGAHGNGVTIDVTTPDELNRAVKRAQVESTAILLQQQVYGSDIRVLVIGGKLAAAAERVPANVIGDGKHTLRELIAIENQSNQSRGVNYEKPLNIIDLEASETYLGKKLSNIPAKGEQVQVVGTANIGSGGSAINRTGDLPLAMIHQAELFAKTVGAFTCGVDFMYDRAAGTWYFIEANMSPSFGLHLRPSVGSSVDVTNIFIDRLLAAYDQSTSPLVTIGCDVQVDIIGYVNNVPAKVDTGADTSAIWASDISIDENGILEFVLFDKESPLYTGKAIRRKQFRSVLVRSSNGHPQVRYKVQLSIRIAGKKVRASFTLADRSRNQFPILIGRRTLRKKFLVDVDRRIYPDPPRPISDDLNIDLAKDPHKFHKKHYPKSNQSTGESS